MAEQPTTKSNSNPAGILKRTNAYFADPASIMAGRNIRQDFGDLAELEDSIMQYGFLKHKPLVVRRIDHESFKFELRGRGGRRFQAVQNLIKAGKKFPNMEEGVPVVIEDKDITDLEAISLDVVDNQQKSLLPMEEAAAYKVMKDAGLTIKQICEKVNRKHVHVISTLALLEADEEIKAAVTNKDINSTLAKKIATKARGDKQKQKELLKTAKAGKAGKKLAKEQAEGIKRRPVKKDTQQTVTGEEKKCLTPSQLKTREAYVTAHVTKALEKAGKSQTEAMKEINKSDELKLAYHLGILNALRGACGHEVKFTL